MVARQKDSSTAVGPTPRPQKLNRAERAQLVQLEDVIETARNWAIEEAKALLEIRDKKLWRGNHSSFEEYGADRWGYEHSQLYRLAQWAQVVKNVSPFGEIPLRESHARPLYGLTEVQQRRAWQLVCSQKKARRSAAEVEAVVQVLLNPTRPQRIVPTGHHAVGTVLCADCIDGIKTLDDQSVDLFLFSPPYCEQRHAHYPGVPETRYAGWMAEVMTAIKPKLVKHGNVLIVAREHLRNGQITDVWLRTRLAVRDLGYVEAETLIWHAPDKPPLGRADRPRRTFEYIYWFALGAKPFIDVRACGKPPLETRTKMLRPRLRKNSFGEERQIFSRFRRNDVSRATDIIVAPVGGVSVGIDHPAMFPLSLADQLVRTFCPADGMTADPMCGSGTALLAARDAGRRWWGCDVVPEYVKLARQRLLKRK